MNRFGAVVAVAVAVALAGATGCLLFDKEKRRPKKPEPATFSQYHLAGWRW